MDKHEIENKLKYFVSSELLDESVDFNRSTSFSSLGISSLSIIEIILFIERQFDVILPESELTPGNLNSIGSLAAVVEKYHSK